MNKKNPKKNKKTCKKCLTNPLKSGIIEVDAKNRSNEVAKNDTPERVVVNLKFSTTKPLRSLVKLNKKFSKIKLKKIKKILKKY
jgi:hypothetical protein